MPLHRFAAIVLIAGTSGVLLFGQSQSSERSKFDVASVKASGSSDGRALLQATPGRLTMTNLSLQRMILIAYDVQDYQIAGASGWIDSESYDIQARANGNPSVQEMEGPMLRNLLADRFRLAAHRETRQLPVFGLVIAKSGTKAPASKDGSCIPYVTNAPPVATVAGEPRPVYCGLHASANGLNRGLDGKGVTMAALAGSLSRSYTAALGRTVVDETQLAGEFDIHLMWTMDSPAPAPETPATDIEGSSLFAALQEQLGLRLESGRGPVDMLVIDHVEKPSGN